MRGVKRTRMLLVLACAALALLATAALLAALAGPATAAPTGGATATPSPLPAEEADFVLPGSQPGDFATPIKSAGECLICHSNYEPAPVADPYFTWQGSMMAHSARDPLFRAALAVANQDVEGVGTFCLRCHAPGAWLQERGAPDGSQLNLIDEEGINCHFCHRLLDPFYQEGVSPSRDLTLTAALSPAVPLHGAGMYAIDPDDERRGPWELRDEGWHAPGCTPQPACGDGNPHRPLDWPWQSQFHVESAFCGTCHDLLNPMFVGSQAEGYQPHPLGVSVSATAVISAFPEQRTYTEWLLSDYATQDGVYAPQFNPNLPGGVVRSCQDCHMPSVAQASAAEVRHGTACAVGDVPCPVTVTHALVAVHDLTGANTWIPETLKIHPVYSATVAPSALDAGIARARAMLEKAATLTATLDGQTLHVRITNESGHKLPTGYPEGRQMWLAVTAFGADGQALYASGVYDDAAGELIHDADLRRFYVEQGLSADWAAALGKAAGPTHHVALNNAILFDNRIPPRGFENAAFLAADIAPAGEAYADGQYWADAAYSLPPGVVRVLVELRYQTASRDYVAFLRDANYTTADGELLYTLWQQTGRSAPVTIARLHVPGVIFLPVVVR
jgi:hypothetical protein